MGAKYLGQRGGAARQQGEAERQGGATVRTARGPTAS